MKILVVSDTHGNDNKLYDLWETGMYSDVFHCGDSEVLNGYYFNPKIVKGNSYLDGDYPLERIVNINGKKVLILHGHTYNIYNRLGISKLQKYARNLSVNIVCYGHTHRSKVYESDGIIFLNPGSMTLPRDDTASYAVIEIADKVSISIFNMLDEEIGYYEKS